MLITFQDGEAMISREASDGDEVAQQTIGETEAALLNPPCACENEQDGIGRCFGSRREDSGTSVAFSLGCPSRRGVTITSEQWSGSRRTRWVRSGVLEK